MSSSFSDLRVWPRFDEAGEGNLSSHGCLSEARVIWLESTDAARCGFGSQQHRCGQGPHSNEVFASFFLHACGSLLELQTQIEIAGELQYLREPDVKRLLNDATAVGRSLSGLINSLGTGSANDQRPTTNDQMYVRET
jgi:hypothetical protein